MVTHAVEVTTWHLEQHDPAQARPGRNPQVPVQIIRAEIPTPELNRFLYTSAGGDLHWTGRIYWSYDRWLNWLDRPGVETWIAHVHGTPAGYIELEPQPDGVVEIAYFGLLPAFEGRGIGGHLLAEGTARAWDLATRWPELPPTRRVWVHTCSLDGPVALGNYQSRGFELFKTETKTEELLKTPIGPWPAATRRVQVPRPAR